MREPCVMKPCDIEELMAKVKQAAEKMKAHEKIREVAVTYALSSSGE